MPRPVAGPRRRSLHPSGGSVRINGEPRQFAESYGKLTQACNNCHATMDHPFVVIKAPDASAWPNQDFKPGTR